jgi:long-chain acyl-CoA synthetase
MSTPMISPTLERTIAAHAASHPGKVAVATEGSDHTYAGLAERVARAASALHGLGIRPGGRVLWLGPTSHRVVELLAACGRLGALLCPANPRQKPAELAVLLGEFRPTVVFSAAPAPDDLAGATWISLADDSYEDLLATASGEAPAAPADSTRGALVLYTAAFDGRPAGAVLTEEALLLQGLTHLAVLQLSAEDVNLVVVPQFHIFGWVATLAALVAGGGNVFVPKADAEEVCRLIEKYGITTGPIMPPTAIAIAELNADRRYDLSKFRTGLRIRGWRDMTTPGPTVGGFGQTETTGPVLLAPADAKLGGPIQGRPAPLASVRIVDDGGHDLGVGEVGELVVSGPLVTRGYLDRPELNAERSAGGWWHTRDLCRRDADGLITFIGPKARMIKTGGENVYPAEVEACLESHPDITGAAVIGRPDQTWGQIVTAVVAAKAAPLDLEALEAFARERLAPHKVPRAFEVVEAIPRSPAGKDYAVLDDQFGGGNYPGGQG